MFNYVNSNKEIACHSKENALMIAKILLDESHVVMLSKEEDLTIVNYLWSSSDGDRNDVCFNYREEVEEFIFGEKED